MPLRHSGEAGLPFDDVEFESRLVWILGSPRTGSTWLLEQLCDPLRLEDSRASGFVLPRASVGPVDALPVNEFLVSSHIAPVLGDPVERDGRLLPATLNNYLDHKPAYLFARDSENVWRPALRRLVLVRLYGVEARAAEEGMPLAPSPLPVVDEVNGSHAADLLMSLLPRSRMLFVVRDGRDVLDSRLHALQKGGWLAEYEGRARFTTPEERLGWTRKACREWACGIDATQRAYEAHDPALRRMVRYEHLISDPGGVLGTLFEWLGLERSAARVGRIVADHAFTAIAEEKRGAGRKRRAATPGLWRQNLTPAEQQAATELMGDRLAALGYPR